MRHYGRVRADLLNANSTAVPQVFAMTASMSAGSGGRVCGVDGAAHRVHVLMANTYATRLAVVRVHCEELDVFNRQPFDGKVCACGSYVNQYGMCTEYRLCTHAFAQHPLYRTIIDLAREHETRLYEDLPSVISCEVANTGEVVADAEQLSRPPTPIHMTQAYLQKIHVWLIRLTRTDTLCVAEDGDSNTEQRQLKYACIRRLTALKVYTHAGVSYVSVLFAVVCVRRRIAHALAGTFGRSLAD
jgi:hypothetical protein